MNNLLHFYLMFFISRVRAGSSGLQLHHLTPSRAVGLRWSLELSRTQGCCSGSWTWVWRNALLWGLQNWNFPFVENSTSLIFFKYFFLIQRNILDMRNFLWAGNLCYRTSRKESVQFFQQTGGRAEKTAWFSWIPLQSSVHWATQPLQDFCVDTPNFPTELWTWAKGEVTTLLTSFFLISSSEAETQEQRQGWLQGMQFSFLWKFLFCWLGVLFSISLPSCYCGAELSQGVDCAERRKKKGRFHLAWIYPGSDFLPEILIWNRFFPLLLVVVYNLWRVQGWTVNLLAPTGLAKHSGKRQIDILACGIKNQVYYSHGCASAPCWALCSTLKIRVFMWKPGRQNFLVYHQFCQGRRIYLSSWTSAGAGSGAFDFKLSTTAQ